MLTLSGCLQPDLIPVGEAKRQTNGSLIRLALLGTFPQGEGSKASSISRLRLWRHVPKGKASNSPFSQPVCKNRRPMGGGFFVFRNSGIVRLSRKSGYSPYTSKSPQSTNMPVASDVAITSSREIGMHSNKGS